MNRSILIVICDFLLVSLLVFSTPDTTKITGETGAAAVPASEQATNAPSGGKDLAMVMRTALTEEQQKREQLQSELEKSRKTATQTQKQLTDAEKRAQSIQQERANLQQQYAAAQTNISTLNEQLNARSTEATLTKEQLAALQADTKKQEDQAAALKKQLAELEKANQAALAEREKLTNQLQMADLERKHAAEMAAQAQQQVQQEREEKAQLQQQNTKLAEGVKTLASKSGELAQEIRENRPLASNTIFNDFVTNAVEVSFAATRSGLFGGEATKDRTTKTILLTDGTNTVAMCHVSDTPMTFWIPPADWESMSVKLQHDGGQLPVPALRKSPAAWALAAWNETRRVEVPLQPDCGPSSIAIHPPPICESLCQEEPPSARLPGGGLRDFGAEPLSRIAYLDPKYAI